MEEGRREVKVSETLDKMSREVYGNLLLET